MANEANILLRIEQLERELSRSKEEFKNIVNKLRQSLSSHRHIGIDGSRSILGGEIKTNKITISAPGKLSSESQSGGVVTSPFDIIDGDFKDLTTTRRGLGMTAAVAGKKGSVREQIASIFGASLSSNNLNRFDFDRSFNSAQVTLAHSPQGGVPPAGSGILTPLSFFYGLRTPALVSSGSITNGGTTLTDGSLTLKTNALVNCILNIYGLVGGEIQVIESHLISSNTDTVITISGSWASASGSYPYVVAKPILLGAADFPWELLYVRDFIRFGHGATSGGSRQQTFRLKKVSDTGLELNQALLGWTVEDQSALTNNFTLTPKSSVVTVGTISANVNASSITQGIAGQILMLAGRSTLGSNTVTILTTTANVSLNTALGNAVLGANDTLLLLCVPNYASGNTRWVEISRSNN